MSIRKILAPIRGDGYGHFVLDHALAIAARLECHVEALFVNSDIASLVPDEVLLGSAMKNAIDRAVGSHTNEERERVRKRFDAYCRSHGIAPLDGVPPVPGGMTVSWQQASGRQSNIVCDRGMLSDLIVVSRPDPETRLGLNSLQSALFCSGKPVLVVPYQEAGNLGSHVAIAWNASAVAAKAISMAMPLLSRADRVTVLCSEKKQSGNRIGDDLLEYLRLHGIDAQLRLFSKNGSKIAGILVAEAQASGADLLVTGAFGRSRRQELVLGGATQGLVWNVALPMLMAH